MHSPFKHTLVNANMRHIYWPHFDGDPTSYWMRMGWSFIGGPQVINASAAPAVFRSPYMFARKVDPNIDAEAVRDDTRAPTLTQRVSQSFGGAAIRPDLAHCHRW